MTNSDSGTAIQVRAIKEYLLARKISPETLRCLFAGFELDSVVSLVKSHFGNFPGIETATRVAVQSILLGIKSGSAYFCPEHKYNSPHDSGFALCPQCEMTALGGANDRRNTAQIDGCAVKEGERDAARYIESGDR